MTTSFIDSESNLQEFLDIVASSCVSAPRLYVDVEGVNLSREGSVSLLTIFVPSSKNAYLIDIHVLKDKAFSTEGKDAITLKRILESTDYTKVFFDVRCDSNALFFHFGINLRGVMDLQLMENATRNFGKRCLNGLSRCIENNAQLSSRERDAWVNAKKIGKRLFDPANGGSYDVFNKRPLPNEIEQYSVQDVTCMPKLWDIYTKKLSPTWREKVVQETQTRITQSQSISFNGNGRHMALAPNWAAVKAPNPLANNPSEQTTALVTRSSGLSIHDLAKLGLSTTENVATKDTSHLTAIRELCEKPQPDEMSPAEDNSDFAGIESPDEYDHDYKSWPDDYEEVESIKDFTACSADSCGNCGHCDY